jgi:hypothetical protein
MFSSATREQILYVCKVLLEILEAQSLGLAGTAPWRDSASGHESADIQVPAR